MGAPWCAAPSSSPYSKASKALITIDEVNNELIIIIEDNGKGFKTTKSKSNEGFGLTQIRARISSMNGKIAITSVEDTGTLIIIKIPVKEKN